MLVPRCIYPKSIFAKCTLLACLLSFASLLICNMLQLTCVLLTDFRLLFSIKFFFIFVDFGLLEIKVNVCQLLSLCTEICTVALIQPYVDCFDWNWWTMASMHVGTHSMDVTLRPAWPWPGFVLDIQWTSPTSSQMRSLLGHLPTFGLDSVSQRMNRLNLQLIKMATSLTGNILDVGFVGILTYSPFVFVPLWSAWDSHSSLTNN